jgi:CHAT domain-containing protein/tetratricopeptide (TPR) repeat protein
VIDRVTRSFWPLVLAASLHCGCQSPEAPRAASDGKAAATVAPSTPVLGPDGRPVSWNALASCPEGDKPWTEARLDAQDLKRVDEFCPLVERLIGACGDRWEPTWIHAECLRDLKMREPAEREFRKALDLARRKETPVGVARAGYKLAWMEMEAGRTEESKSLFDEALAGARGAQRRDLQGHALNGLASVLRDLGRYRDAAGAYDEAVAAFRDVGSNSLARRVTYNRCVLLVHLGDINGAAPVLEKLFDELAKGKDKELQAYVAVELGLLNLLRGDYDRAQEWYDRVPDSSGNERAQADLDRGRIALRLGDYAHARQFFEPASRQNAVRGIALVADAYLAEVDQREGRSDGCLPRLTHVIHVADKDGLEEPAWISRWLSGKILRMQARPREAVEPLRGAVTLLEKQHADLDPFGDGLNFLRERLEPYVELAGALRDVGSPDEVFDIAEKTHARALRWALRGNAGTTRSSSLDDIRSRLRDDEIVLDFLVGQERGVLVAVRRQDAHTFDIPGQRDLEVPIRRYLAALQRPLRSADVRDDPTGDLARTLSAGALLREQILGSVAPLMRGARRVYIVPDGPLALLPFATLPWPSQGTDGGLSVFGEDHELAVLPLAGLPPAWATTAGPVLVAGDPLPDEAGMFPALPLAKRELDLVSEVWGPERVQRIEGRSLTKQELLGRPLHDFSIIHLATHAVASSANPSGCAVFLSRGEPLHLDDLASMQLQAGPLVTLSACRTGEGELVPGEGVVGLTWAFLRAGARGVVASLWAVDDESTTELMSEFHRHLRSGNEPVAALSLAQRAVAKRRPHPAYWAPFVIVLRPDTAGGAFRPLPPQVTPAR